MDRLLQVYKCFCDETRLRILNLLRTSPLCVCHLQHVLDVSQVNVSRHLAYLRKHGLVHTTRHRNWTIYALPDTPPPELDLNLRCLQDLAVRESVFVNDTNALRDLLKARDVRELLSEGGCPLPASAVPRP